MSPDPFDPDALRAALAVVPESAWSLPSRYADTGVHHGNRRIVLVDNGRRLDAAEPWAFVLDRFAPVRTSWLSWLAPGGFIVPHRDAGPWCERWQVPIQAAGMFGGERPVDGVPFRVEHWRPHAVWNDTDRPRIHLVLDRENLLELPASAFELFPVPAEYEHFIEEAR